MAYAETTTVAFEKSIADIITLLRKAGADPRQIDIEDSIAARAAATGAVA